MDPSYKTLLKAVERLGSHDHLCLIYETREEQFAAVIPFIRIGLERGEKCIYIADENTFEQVLAAMANDGIDTDKAIRSGALSLLTKKDAYLKQGYFDPEWMINLLKEATDKAKLEGYSALRATGEMTWMLGGDPGSERLIEYESKLNYFFPENDALAICQYNIKRFKPEIILDVIRTHPLVIYRGQVCRNFYYVSPDEMMLPDQVYLEVDRLLFNIFEHERVEELRREIDEELQKRELELRETERVGKVGSWEWDAVDDTVVWSPGTYLIFGLDPSLPPPDYTGHLKLYAPDDAERLVKAVKQALNTGAPYELELELACISGVRRWVIARGEARYDQKGKAIGLCGTVIDITERKLVLEELYNNAPCGFHSLDKDGRFVRVNDTELKWLGYKREDVIGKMKITDVMTPGSIAAFMQSFPRFLETGLARDLEFELVRKDGTTFSVLLSAIAIKDSNGKYQMSNSIVYDITKRKQAEDELKKVNSELLKTQAKVKMLEDRYPQADLAKGAGRDLKTKKTA